MTSHLGFDGFMAHELVIPNPVRPAVRPFNEAEGGAFLGALWGVGASRTIR